MLKKVIILSTIIGLSGLLNTFVFADTTTTAPAPTDAVSQREALLQAQLNDVLAQIAQQQQVLAQEQQKGASLSRDISILDTQIKQAQLNIQAHQLAIQALGKDISTKNATIQVLSSQISQSQDSLAHLIRETNEMDAFSVADVVFSDSNISDFFIDTDTYDVLKQSIVGALTNIQQSKTDNETAKQQLSQQQLQEIDAKISIQDEQDKIKASETEKNRLLSLSKAQQKNYTSEINQREAEADSIRSALFALRDTAAIPFGQALDFANLASKATGVEPAFLLAILTQESNLGANVGSCYVTDQITGNGVKVTTGAAVSGVMKPGRDIPAFLQIMSALGRDPASTRVSCPQGGGYGGAMGPSQFIPSTWQLFQNRIAVATGDGAPDPWNPKDAFMASALYLSDLGASGGGYSSERNAACRYYSGRSCDSKKPANSFYGDQVMAKATSIQSTMIDPLSGV